MPFVIAGLVFGLLLAIGLTIASTVERSMVLRRMEQIGDLQPSDPLLTTEFTKSWRQRIVTPMLRNVSGWIVALAPATLLRANRERLQRAGHPWGLMAEGFLTLRLVSLVVGLLAAAAVLRLTGVGAGFRFLLAIGAAGAGCLAPAWIVDRIASKRCRQIKKALPNIIDLLVVSVEAGLGLDGAIAEIIDRESGPLVDEFKYALTEIRLGKHRRDAWRSLGKRAQVADLSAFMAALCQAEELGSSISKVLRTHSETLRIKRSIQVRELANKIPVKMLFPLIFFIFPSMFIVILGPGAISIMHTMGNLGK